MNASSFLRSVVFKEAACSKACQALVFKLRVKNVLGLQVLSLASLYDAQRNTTVRVIYIKAPALFPDIIFSAQDALFTHSHYCPAYLNNITQMQCKIIRQ